MAKATTAEVLTDGTLRETGQPAGSPPATGSFTEIEVKYDAADAFELPLLLDLPGVAAVEQPVEQRLAATYFDTADLRLARAQLTLRRRTGGDDAGWHLKLPKARDERVEMRRPLGRATRTPPKVLVDVVRAYVRDQALVPVATLETHRTVHRLLDATGAVLVEVADDHVVAERLVAPLPAVSWREVEAELVSGDASLLAAVGGRLLTAGATAASTASKLARVLADAVAQPAAPTSGGIDSSAAARDVVQAHLAEQVAALLRWDRSARTDESDAVHKMRVATRRLRSALATYRPLLDRTRTDPVRAELQWLGQVLGEPRDAEVMLARVRALVAEQPAELVLGAVRRRVDRELRRRHRETHARMVTELGSERYFRLLDALDALAGAPPFTGRADRSATKALPLLVKRTRERVLALADEAADESSPSRRDELLHDVRKAAKRARYAGESVAPALGAKASAYAAGMEHLQEVLGEHQDSAATRDLLRELGVQAHLAGENGFTFGRLHGLEQCRGERAAERYDGALAAVRDLSTGWLRPRSP